MSSDTDTKRDAFLAKFNSIGSFDPADFDNQLEKLVTAAGYVLYIGHVYHAGIQVVASAQNYFVSFIADSGPSRSGGWPDWAYPVAREAVLHGKKVQLVADGPPSGDNLIWVANHHESV